MSDLNKHWRTEAVSCLADLGARLFELRSQFSGTGSRPNEFVRIEVPAPAWDVLSWLSLQEDEKKFFWSSRDSRTQLGGIGQAHSYRGVSSVETSQILEDIETTLERSSGDIRFYGGISFNHRSLVADEWSKFGACSFWLPRFELRREHELNTLACNLVLPRDADLLEDIDLFLSSLTFDKTKSETEPEIGLASRTGNIPDQETWTENIDWSLDAFDHTDLEKIVLARRAVFSFQEETSSIEILNRLRKETSNCFYFLFQADENHSFFGATPERLFRKNKRKIKTEAVAGTRTLTSNLNRNAELASELLTSDKDRREHEYVRLSIHEALSPLMEKIEEEIEPHIMYLEHHLHLATSFSGTLRRGIGEKEILAALHPTPAVGGYPGELALEVLDRIEAFNRGWYAGPIGWIGKDQSEFAVAIRSGLLCNRQLNLYSGAGIVPGSQAEKEWLEIENKIGDFLRLLTIE